MTRQASLVGFILKEWLLAASASALALTCVYLKRLPVYSLDELQVLLLLLALFVAVKGMQRSGLLHRVSRRIQDGKAIGLKLVLMTFFLSMVVTNDAALVAIVPLTLLVDIPRRDVLVILEALAANAGSALTPIGNPQNLFIYWSYGLSPAEFVWSIAPFSIVFLVLLTIGSLALGTGSGQKALSGTHAVHRSAYVYGVLLLLVVLAVLRVVPAEAAGVVLLYAVLFDRKSLRVDYVLLITFVLFFGLAENMKILLTSELKHREHVFLFSAIFSQFMSNVPATVLFAKFTAEWEELLWGANVGGFGSLVGSLSNLIAYRLYVTHEGTSDAMRFTIRFLVLGYAAFFIGIGLRFLLQAT